MEYISTRYQSNPKSISEAIYSGLAFDKGLYIPRVIPKNSEKLDPNEPFAKFSSSVIKPYFQSSYLFDSVESICQKAFDFELVETYVEENQAFAELYHGPTLAFKDYGCRFLSNCLEKIVLNINLPVTILAATSGDTGSAVASAMHKKKLIEVRLLFPYGKVSKRQEKQLTIWGDNIRAYSVHGTFDDCQNMVKESFLSGKFRRKFQLSSSNSINIARLLPQMAYAYYLSYRFYNKTGKKPVLIIPTGNVGNSLGALWAKEMGAPIKRVCFGVNKNKTIFDYFNSGIWQPRKSIKTLANAMDVGNPSNMERVFSLYPTLIDIKKNIDCYSVDDELIKNTIKQTYENHKKIICPHTAIGQAIREKYYKDEPTIVYETAHPSKFEEVIEPILGFTLPIPEKLKNMLNMKSHVEEIEPDLDLFFKHLTKR